MIILDEGDTMSRDHARLILFLARFQRFRLRGERRDRGDVPGWVLVTLMTAGLVITIWAVAGPRLEEVFNHAIDSVVGGP